MVKKALLTIFSVSLEISIIIIIIIIIIVIFYKQLIYAQQKSTI